MCTDATKADGEILFHPRQRTAFLRTAVGMGAAQYARLHRQEGGLYSWWDYRALALGSERNLGFRIDHILVTPPAWAVRCTAVTLERELRELPKPSDRCLPVVATFVEPDPCGTCVSCQSAPEGCMMR